MTSLVGIPNMNTTRIERERVEILHWLRQQVDNSDALCFTDELRLAYKLKFDKDPFEEYFLGFSHKNNEIIYGWLYYALITWRIESEFRNTKFIGSNKYDISKFL